jgi:heme A synthase
VVGVQLLVGVVNVWLLTPIAMQLIHLLLADVLWISWVWLGAALSTAPARSDALVE